MLLYKRCPCAAPSRCAHAYWYQFEFRGRRFRRSTRTANRQTADRIATRRKNAAIEGKSVEEPSAILLSAHIKDYLKYTKAEHVTHDKGPDVLARLLAVCGDRMLGEISPFYIEKWKIERAKVVQKTTVNRELNVIRGCFTKAIVWKRLAVSPCASVEAFKVDDGRIRVLTDREMQLVLSAEPFVALICRITLECLLRISEVIAIRHTHIGPTWIEVRRKGGRVDRIPITDDLRTTLLAEDLERTFGLTQAAASVRVYRAFKELGLKGVSHHTMRHTGVTLALEAGRNPRAIQKLAGWTSLRMLERYGHARDAELQNTVTGNADYLKNLQEQTDESHAQSS